MVGFSRALCLASRSAFFSFLFSSLSCLLSCFCSFMCICNASCVGRRRPLRLVLLLGLVGFLLFLPLRLLGLMLGVETEKPAGEIVSACLARGVLVLTAKSKVRLLPPLNIGWDDLEKAIAILKEVIGG